MPGEADFASDDVQGQQPFDVEKQDEQLRQKRESGELQAGEPLSEVASRLGVESETLKDEKESKKEEILEDEKVPDKSKNVLKDYSGLLQDYSEELYESMAYRAKTEDGFLEEALGSENSVEKKLAKKVLERNKDHFGTTDPDEYLLSRKKEQAKDDPNAQAQIETDSRMKKLEKEVEQSRWDQWKSTQGIQGDLSKKADEIHSEFPKMSYGRIVNFAKGELGHVNTSSQKRDASGVQGAVSHSEGDFQPPSKLLRQLKVGADDVKFARKFLGSV